MKSPTYRYNKGTPTFVPREELNRRRREFIASVGPCMTKVDAIYASLTVEGILGMHTRRNFHNEKNYYNLCHGTSRRCVELTADNGVPYCERHKQGLEFNKGIRRCSECIERNGRKGNEETTRGI